MLDVPIVLSFLLISSAICHGNIPSIYGLAVDTNSRIIGGTVTTIDKYPYIVGIMKKYWGRKYIQTCSGSVLTSRHILSAAHCFHAHTITGKDHSQPHHWMVRCGSTSRSGGIFVAVYNIINHPQFNVDAMQNDISIVVLASELPLGSSIMQASIPRQNYMQPDYYVGYVIGWGITSGRGHTSSILRQGQVRTVNQNTCTKRYRPLGWEVDDSMFCAGVLDVGGIDACQGDSGGPFILNDVVIGVTSFGEGCGTPFYPGVYTKVSFYTNWIVSVVDST